MKVTANSPHVQIAQQNFHVVHAALQLNGRSLETTWWIERQSDRSFHELSLSLKPAISRPFLVRVSLLYSNLEVPSRFIKTPPFETRAYSQNNLLTSEIRINSGSTGVFTVKINELSSSHNKKPFRLKFEIPDENFPILPCFTDPITTKTTNSPQTQGDSQNSDDIERFIADIFSSDEMTLLQLAQDTHRSVRNIENHLFPPPPSDSSGNI